jgi:hypothetical protein
VWTLAGLGLLCIATVGLEGALRERKALRLMWSDPAALADWSRTAPSFDAVIIGTGGVMLLLELFHLAWPVELSWGGHVTTSLVASAGTLLGAAGLLFLAARRWSPAAATLGLGLVTLGVTGLTPMLLGREPASLDQRYSGHWNVLLFGFSMMTAFWLWLAGVWQQQLDGTAAWTPAGRLLAILPRIGLGAGAMGVLTAFVLAVWPRLVTLAPRGSGFDDVVLGVAGHLVLILVLLAAGRRWGRPAGIFLAAQATVSLVIFCVVRVAEFVEVER